ncbi:universal stress protein, partial [bacterium]
AAHDAALDATGAPDEAEGAREARTPAGRAHEARMRDARRRGRFSSLVVAVDLGEASRLTFDVACDLATRLGARLSIVHVLESHPFARPPSTQGERPQGGAGLAANALIDELVLECRARGVVAKGEVRSGDPSREIRACADEHAADLVILGSRARAGISRALFGSVAEDVVASADAPVLTVHGDPSPALVSRGTGGEPTGLRPSVAPTGWRRA